jgi:glycosyltransferase involved in cell wall biosynthesis
MRIVIASPILPYPGVPHAGGEFLLRHIQALMNDHEVALLVPRKSLFPQDESVLPLIPCPTYMIDATGPKGRVGRITEFVRMTANPTSIFRDFWTYVDANPAARTVARNADLIELQWFEMATTAVSLRQRGVSQPLFGFYHDVMSQRLERQFRSARGPSRRLLKGLRWLIVRRRERRVVKILTMNIFLSEKDADLLRSSATDSKRIVVLNPPLDEPDMPDRLPDLQQRRPIALFVASFGRVENDDSARWFLAEIWPSVHAAYPEARLVLAGGGMSPELRHLVDSTPGASSTGYLPSLAATYRSARVAVSPVTRGAGVKFKSIVPMLWGVPVIATTIGAEGIERDLFLAVEDRPSAFAEALTRAIEKPSSFDELRRKAWFESRRIYAGSSYLETVRRIYAGKHAFS